METKLFNFKRLGDERGELIALEENRSIPFEIKRVYYLINTVENVTRGMHSHKKLEQCLICVSGSVKILLDDGEEKKIICLDNPSKGLYIGPNVWREMYDFSSGAVLLVLASEYYDESDYIRDYSTFLNSIKK